MTLSQTNKTVARFDLAARLERQAPPETIQRNKAVRFKGGDSYTFAKVVTSLSWPENDDVSTYTLRLVADGTEDWAAGNYVSGDLVIDTETGGGGKKYECKTGTAEEPFDSQTAPHSDSANWNLVNEITPKIFNMNGESDYRLFVPWLAKDAIVPIASYGGNWYILGIFVFVGEDKSITWYETDWRIISCFAG